MTSSSCNSFQKPKTCNWPCNWDCIWHPAKTHQPLQGRVTALLPCSWNRLEPILSCAKEGLPLSWTPVIHPSVSLKSSPQSKLILSSNSCLGDSDGLFTAGKALGDDKKNCGLCFQGQTPKGEAPLMLSCVEMTKVAVGGVGNFQITGVSTRHYSSYYPTWT